MAQHKEQTTELQPPPAARSIMIGAAVVAAFAAARAARAAAAKAAAVETRPLPKAAFCEEKLRFEGGKWVCKECFPHAGDAETHAQQLASRPAKQGQRKTKPDGVYSGVRAKDCRSFVAHYNFYHVTMMQYPSQLYQRKARRGAPKKTKKETK